MKYKKNLNNFFIEKKISYNTSVTATKGEKIAINLYLIFFIILILINILIFKNIIYLIISMFLGITGLFLLMIFIIFRPIHKNEKIENERLFKK